MMPSADFSPPNYLANAHTQTIFASVGPRKWALQRRCETFLQASEAQMIYAQGDPQHGDVRLLAMTTRCTNPTSHGLVMLIHGWEGCAESLQLISLGDHLWRQGYDVVRLNLRDHGPTKHLNQLPFTSTRHAEVVDACNQIHQQFARHSSQPYFLVGYSLGGNFCARIASDEGLRAPLNKAIAVCPPLNPNHTLKKLEQSWRLYHDYYRSRWQQSLKQKQQQRPDLRLPDELLTAKSLRQMHYHFAPHFSDYPDCDTYMQAYSLCGPRLQQLQAQLHLLISADDPIIDVDDLDLLAKSPGLTIEVQQKGGHCGFIESINGQVSWCDRRIAQLLRET